MIEKVMIIAGEASGDLHGSGVVRELKRLVPNIDIYGVGGEKMEKEGMKLIYNINELNFMGFWEVIKHIPTIKTMEYALKQVLRFKKPDVLILIDYPGFNIRFGTIAKQFNVKIVYYVSPQVWAWYRSRINKIKLFVDKMLVILPFEEKIYRSAGIDVEYVGHPIVEVVDSSLDKSGFRKMFGLNPGKKIIAILPGSRPQEIDLTFREMLSAARIINQNKEVEIVVGVAPTIDESYFRTFFNVEGIHLIKGFTYELMANADFAFVTSGTATLETACFGTPMFIVYKTSWINYLIGLILVKVKYIGLVNIIAGRKIVPEFIQYKVSGKQLAKKALKLMDDQEKIDEMKKNLLALREMLGGKGASHRVAEIIFEMG